jgi:cytochrome c oxidase assembly factor CtaG
MAHSTLSPSWGFALWVAAPLGLVAGLYARGWLRLHRRAPRLFGVGRLAVFLAGLAALVVALDSPLHALGAYLLQAHMAQHILLMMVAPPLLLLGAPLMPMLRGLPRSLMQTRVVRFVTWQPVARCGQFLVHPLVAWPAFVCSTLAWHVPVLFDLTLRSHTWHHAEHICFLATGLAFWWPVVQPWPSRRVWPAWAMVVYLILADLQNTALSAWLAFADRVVYSAYEGVPRLWGISTLDDQAAAGAIMWVLGSLAFVVPAAWLVTRLLTPKARPAAGDGSLRAWAPRIPAPGATSEISFPRSRPL